MIVVIEEEEQLVAGRQEEKSVWMPAQLMTVKASSVKIKENPIRKAFYRLANQMAEGAASMRTRARKGETTLGWKKKPLRKQKVNAAKK
jgi:hypothetical protein